MIGKLKNNIILITSIIVMIIVLLLVYFLINNNKKTDTKIFKNDYYSFTYDTTWELTDNKKEVILNHNNKKSTITITHKELDTYLIDIELKDMISDVIYEVEKQNKDYKLLNKQYNEKYDRYELLYEKNKEQSLVYIIKQDNMLVFLYYNSLSETFDITLDGFDTISNTLKIKSGERID